MRESDDEDTQDTRVVNPLVRDAPAKTRVRSWALTGRIRELLARMPSQAISRIALIAALIAVAIASGLAWSAWNIDSRNSGASPSRKAQSSSSSAPTLRPDTPRDVADWTKILVDLDQRRGVAFETADEQLLKRVYLPGSAVLRADQTQIAALRDAGSSAEGVRHEVAVLAVAPASASGARIVLRTSDTMQPYRIRDKNGTISRDVMAGSARELTVTMRRVDGSWRIADIKPAQ